MQVDVEKIWLACCAANDMIFPNFFRERLTHVLLKPLITCFSHHEMAILDYGQKE
jgi:hypothetical protein